MIRFFRVFQVSAVLFGALGIILCAVGIVAVWSFGFRLLRANETFFDASDQTLATVHDRVIGVQQLVQESLITTESIQQDIKSLLRKESGEFIASRLEIEENAQKLAIGIQQANQWLELSVTSLETAQMAMNLGNSIGILSETESFQTTLEKITSIRNRLTELTELSIGFGSKVKEIADDESREDRTNQAMKTVLRAVATLAELDARLVESSEKISELQNRSRHLRSRAHRWIGSLRMVAIVIIGWMSVGQFSLCQFWWPGRRTR